MPRARSPCIAPCLKACGNIAPARMPPLEAILFDMGGTLDGHGAWRDRFGRLFADLGLEFSHAQRMHAFDYAEQRSHATPKMAEARLQYMLEQHVGWQLECLGSSDLGIEREIVDRFASEVQ